MFKSTETSLLDDEAQIAGTVPSYVKNRSEQISFKESDDNLRSERVKELLNLRNETFNSLEELFKVDFDHSLK